MVGFPPNYESFEDTLARVTDAAYRSLLQQPQALASVAAHGTTFIDVQLGIWSSLRQELGRGAAPSLRPAVREPQRSGRIAQVEVVSWQA